MMRQETSFLKRFIAMALALVLLVSNANLGLVPLAFAAGDASTTAGKLVADSYELTAEEKALLASGYLAGDYTVDYKVPAAEDNLVEVDPDNKLITAKSYEGWEPTTAEIVVNGETVETISLDGNACNYAYAGNAFAVKVSYVLNKNIDNQQMMLDAIADLKQGVANLDAINAQSSNLDTLELAMPTLVDFSNDENFGFGRAAKTAINALNKQMAANGRELNLSVMLNDVASKVQYLLTKGSAMKAEVEELAKDERAYLYAIYDDLAYAIDYLKSEVLPEVEANLPEVEKKLSDANDALSEVQKNLSDARYALGEAQKALENNTVPALEEQLKAEIAKLEAGIADLESVETQLQEAIAEAEKVIAQAEELKTMLMLAESLCSCIETLYTELHNVLENDWTAAEQGTALVSANVDYAKLDELVAALGELSAVTVRNPLKVAETSIQANMSMKNVVVTIKLEVVTDEVDSADLVTYDEKTVTLTLEDNTSDADIVAAVEASGIEAAAIAEWGEAYAAEHFVKSETALPETLTEDIEYVITYSPAEYTVEFDYAESEQYPYGYKLTLPKHEDATKAYDYKVNGEKKAQGTVITIEGDTKITRTTGDAYTVYDLYTIVADLYGDDLAKSILKSGALLDNTQIPVRMLKTAELTLVDGVLTAEKDFPSDYEDNLWQPYSYGVNGNENLFGDSNTANWAEDAAKVQYKLELANISAEEAQAILDLAKTLKEEADGQKSTMDRLAAYRSDMEQLNSTMLPILKSVVSNPDVYGKDAEQNQKLAEHFETQVQRLIDNNLDKVSGKLKIYNMLGEYLDENNGGLRYYYGNSAAIIAEVESLSEVINALIADTDKKDALEDLLESFKDLGDFSAYVDKIEKLDSAMAEAKAALTKPNAKIDLQSNKLGDLLKALESDGTVGELTAGVPYLMSGVLTVADSSKVYVEVTIKSTNNREASVTSVTVTRGEALTAEQIGKLNNDIAAAVANMLGEDAGYYALSVEGKLPAAGEALDAVVEVVYTYNPVVYTVKIEGEADQTVTIEDLEINLPAHESPEDWKYVYTIGAKEANSGIYTFTKDELNSLFVEGVCTIAREAVSVKDSALEEGTLKDWIVKNDEGKIIGLNAKLAANKDGVVDFAFALINSGYGYIGLNGEPLMSDGKLSLQTLVNAILSDNEFSDETVIALGDNGEGQLVKASLQLGTTAENVTYEDLDFTLTLTSVPGQMGTIAKGLKAIKPYMTFKSNNGKLDITLDLPEKVYEVYLTALLATGNVDKNDITAVNSAIAMNFLWDYVDLIWNSDVTPTTFSNTLKKLGMNVNLSGYDGYYKALKDLLTMEGVDLEEVEGDKPFGMEFSAKGKASIDALLKFAGLAGSTLGDTATSMIMEYAENAKPLNVKIAANLADAGTAFEAVVIDFKQLQAAGLKEKAKGYDFAVNAAARINAIKGQAVIMLLDDVAGDLTINGTTILDLNGKNVDGSITVKGGTLYLIDSTLNTENAGVVTGAVSGNAAILGGKFPNCDVTSYLKSGYKQHESGYVYNRLYTLSDVDGNITVNVDTDLLKNRDADYFSFAKALAVDVAADLVLNFYTAAALSVEADQRARSIEYHDLYNVNFDDLIGLLESSTKKADLVQKVLNSINIGEMDGFINDILADLLDFAAIKEAAENDKAFATYSMVTHPFMVSLDHVTKGDHLTFGITSNPKITKNFSISLKAADETDREYIAILADALDVVVDAEIKVTIDEVAEETVEARGLEIPVINGGAYIYIVVDLTKETRWSYAEEIAKILDIPTEEALKAKIDAVTAGKIIDKLESYVDGSNKVEKVAARVLNTLGKLLKKLNVEDKPFGNLETEYGTYVFDKAAHREDVFHGVFDNLDLDVYIEIKIFEKSGEAEHKHTPADVVIENEVAADCENDGSYDEVVYCSVCGEELSRNTVTVPALGHTEADTVVENEVAADCENDGSYDEVVYCSVCGEELSRNTVTVPALGHTEADTVVENEVAADCENDGSYDEVVYCSVCDEELSRETVVVPALGHDYDDGVVTTAPTCSEPGVMTYTCKRDASHTYTEEIPATGEHVDKEEPWHACDVCGIKVSDCVDNDNNGFCDICCRYICECDKDENKDHHCDVCGRRVSWCRDCDRDHRCDICGLRITFCIDLNRNNKCDICGKILCEPEEPEIPETPEIKEIIRISGKERTATARKIADELKQITGEDKFDTIVYASGNVFADALTGSYLANLEDAPILLYRADYVAENLAYIQNNLAKGGTVYMLGGERAIPASVESELVAAGVKVERLTGKTRFETNIEILDEAGFDGGETVLVCTGFESADALSASSLGMPILLVDNGTGELRDTQIEYLNGLASKCDFIIIGGEAAVSEDLANELAAFDYDGNVQRLKGKTRFETSLVLAEAYYNTDKIVLAYGWDFADALCGGTLAHEIGAPIVLADAAKVAGVAAYVESAGVATGYVLGGTARLTDADVRTAFGLAETDVITVK